MEKIQRAIQKARIGRAALESAGTGHGPVAQGLAAHALAPLQLGPAEAVRAAQTDPTAVWMALEEYRPDPRLLERNRIVSFQGGETPAIPFDVMRTRVLQQMRANNWKRLAITSPTPACGKTLTSLNLAFSLGRQADARTIVLEADLRRPSMARTLGVRPHHLFASVMEGKAPAAEHMVRYGTNLAFGTNFMPSRNTAELLNSSRIVDVLAGIEADYDPTLIIFDMPPMQVSDDTLAFLGQVDCVLLVAAAGTSTITDIDVCERELAAQTNVMGVVLNKCRYLDKARGYDYKYYG